MDDAAKAHKAIAAAYQFAESLRPIVEEARAKGITSHDRLADYLTEQGVPTATGHRIWGLDAARKLKARLKKLDAQK
jgi:argininosuccinate lyase